MQGDGNHSGQDHQGGEEHLGHRGDQRRAPGGRHRFRGHGALHDQKVRAPVAERKHKAQAHGHAEPLDPHRIRSRRIEVGPRLCHGARPEALLGGNHGEPLFEAAPAAHILQPKERQRQEADHDQEELQHLVVDGRR
jgi:hypothetical protein